MLKHLFTFLSNIDHHFNIYKMNTKIKTITRTFALISMLSALQLTSCSEAEYLDKTPPTDLAGSDAFTSPQRIESLVNGIYREVKSNNYYGGRYILYLDARGEEFINTTVNSFTGFDAWAHTYNTGSNDVVNVWADAYSTINMANIVIAGVQANTDVVGETLAAQYIAEAKFLRAFAYFSLVTVFAQPYVADNGASPGLPLRLQAETQGGNNDLARSSVADVYTQIINDLNDAEADLPESHATAILNATRAHRNTAIALKTRVFLTQGNWNAVIQEAAKIAPQTSAPFSSTSGVALQLQQAPAEITTTAMISAFMSLTSSEAIFSMPFTELDMLSGQSAPGYIYNGNAEYYMNPAAILGESQWAETDARRSFLRHNTSNDRYYLAKFGFNAPYLNPIPLIRYSEVLLNYAEAAAETGNLGLAANLLQAVHARSDESYEFPPSALASSEALVEAILIERRIELLGEGLRSNDIMRRLLTFPAKPGPTPAGAVPPSSENYIWPMSNNELVNNSLIN